MTEALRSLLARPRVLVTGIAMVVVAVTAMTLIPSLTHSAGAKLLADLDALGSDAWLVEPQPTRDGLPGRLPNGAVARAAGLPGASSALREVTTEVPVRLSAQERSDRGVRVVGVAAWPQAAPLPVVSGTSRPVPGLPFAVLGQRAADELGLTELPATVFAGGRRFVATGVIAGDPLLPELADALVVDAETALALSGATGADRLVIRTAATLDPARIRASVDPLALSALAVGQPEALVAAKQQSTSTLDGLAVYASIAAFGIAGLGIAIMLAAAVRQRTAEIAIRRVHGAPRRAIFGLVAAEGLGLGVLGGALGLAVSAAAMYTVTAVNDWPVEPQYSLFAAAMGAAVLMCQLAAAVPAWLAVRIEPATAFAVE
ncbi:ABC transporter permease [Blastococcus sp. TF02A-35]|uniref:ABC transporter permease n=1 Tax=Blastococcus sp. TF02A-35 TaxID=2559612 RepID=UPI001074136A|nr:ABC transporter permease [Blastococcus sp. TF02A_35]TFV48154.1 ABC transporter permease [Blastococcus sp. TF02A_35]